MVFTQLGPSKDKTDLDFELSVQLTSHIRVPENVIYSPTESCSGNPSGVPGSSQSHRGGQVREDEGGSGQSLTARPRLLGKGNPLPQRWQPRGCHLQRPSWLLSWLPSWLLLFTAVPSGFKNTEEIRARGTVERPPPPSTQTNFLQVTEEDAGEGLGSSCSSGAARNLHPQGVGSGEC